ncbi:MAG: MFS transporter [Pseudomonadota bacterium]
MLSFLRRYFRWIAGGFLLTFCSSFGQTYFIAGSVAEWQHKFDLSHGQFGRLYMLATLASACCFPFVGRVLDIMSARRAVLIFMPLLALATVLAGVAATVPILVLALFALRLCGQGMMTHIAITTTARSFAAQRGRAMSLVVLGHQGGEILLPLTFALIAASMHFSVGWYASAVFLICIGVPLTAWAYGSERDPAGSDPTNEDAQDMRHWTRAEVLRDPIFYCLLLGVLAPAFIGTTIFYHSDYMTELMDWPPTLFASSLAVMAVTTVIVALLFGPLIDRFGSVRLLPVFLVPLTLACIVLSGAGAPWTLFLAIGFVGVSYGVSSTLLGSLWPEVYGTQHLGAIRSIVVAAMVLSTAMGPGITGTLIDAGIALPQQMSGMAAYCVIATLGLAWSRRALIRR